MARFVIRRLLTLCFSAFLAVTLSFLALHVIGGDPAEAVLSQGAVSQEALERRHEALGLDRPLLAQYGRYLQQLMRGDLGTSWFGDQSVSLLVTQQIGDTVSLALSSMLVAAVVGLILGISSAAGRGNWASQVSRLLTSVSLAVPVIFTGVIMIWLFSIQLGWLPATGQEGLRHLVLPALVVGISVAGGIAGAVDAGVTGVLGQQFMRAALAKGLSRWGALFRHGLRVGLLPVVDVIALQFGYLLAGTVITESLFARQGVGRLLVAAVLNKDAPVVLGIVILSILSYSLLNLLADVVHTWLDPRVRLDS